MSYILSQPGHLTEDYADRLPLPAAHCINTDFERKEMSEPYKKINFLVRQRPENKPFRHLP